MPKKYCGVCGEEVFPIKGMGGCVYWGCRSCACIVSFSSKEEVSKWETKENLKSDR